MLKNLKQFNLAEVEERVLKFWEERGIFERSLRGRGAVEMGEKEGSEPGKRGFPDAALRAGWE